MSRSWGQMPRASSAAGGHAAQLGVVLIVALTILALTGLVRPMVPDARAQGADRWVRLASRDLDARTGRASIDLSRAKGAFKAVRIRVQSGALALNQLELRYHGGGVRTERRALVLRQPRRARASSTVAATMRFSTACCCLSAALPASPSGPRWWSKACRAPAARLPCAASAASAPARRTMSRLRRSPRRGARRKVRLGRRTRRRLPRPSRPRRRPRPQLLPRRRPSPRRRRLRQRLRLPQSAHRRRPLSHGRRPQLRLHLKQRGRRPHPALRPRRPRATAAAPGASRSHGTWCRSSTAPTATASSRPRKHTTTAASGPGASSSAARSSPCPSRTRCPTSSGPGSTALPFTQIVLYSETEDPKKHFTLQGGAGADRARSSSGSCATGSTPSKGYKDHALVFVHGFNTSFEHALFRTAQIAYDIKFDGAPFLYSWPSKGALSSQDYSYDRESAGAAEPYLRQFLETRCAGDRRHLGQRHRPQHGQPARSCRCCATSSMRRPPTSRSRR